MYKLSYIDSNHDEITFYDDSYLDDEFVVIDPKLDLDVSSAGSGPCSFSVPPSNIAYNNLETFNTEIRCYKKDKMIWSGRITDIDIDFYNNQKITCEGEFAYLNDTCQPQREYYNVTLRQFLEDIIKIHNNKVTVNGQGPIDRQFTVGYISESILANNIGDIIIPYILTQYESTMKVINDNILSKYNCYIRIRKVKSEYSDNTLIKPIISSEEKYLTTKNGNYLQYGAPMYPYIRYIDIITEDEFATNQEQSIVFGENLLDFTKHYSITDLCTVVVATGESKKQDSDNATEILCPTQYTGLVNNSVYIVNKDQQGNNFIDTKTNCPGYAITENIAVEEDDVIYLTTRLPKIGYSENNKKYPFCVYYVRDSEGVVLTYKSTSKVEDEGFADYIQTKITIPKGGKIFNASYYRNNDVKIEVRKALGEDEQADKYLDVSGASGSLMIPDIEINNQQTTLIRLTQSQYKKNHSSEERMDPLKWWYLTDVDIIANQEKVYKRGIYTINPDALAKYGWIEKVLNLNDISDKEELLQYSNDYVMNGQWSDMTIEVTACDLADLGANVDNFELYTSISIISEPHGLDRFFPLTKMTIDLQHPESNQYKLGNYIESSLTESSNSANQEILEKLKAQPQVNDVLKSAFENAAALINAATTGTVTTYITDEGAEEIIVHNGPKTEEGFRRAKNVWRWNINGLGHGSSPTGALNEAYTMANMNIAIRMDGAINANFITAGILSALSIKGCNMQLGKYDGKNQNGSLNVLNGDGTYAMQINDPSKGVLFESTWGSYFESNHTKTNCRIVNGELYFALSAYTGPSMSNQFSNVTCILNGRTRIETSGGPKYGGSVKAPNFTIAADSIWLDKVTNPRGVIEAYTTTKEIGNVELDFFNGFLVGATQIAPNYTPRYDDNTGDTWVNIANNRVCIKNGSIYKVTPIEGHEPVNHADIKVGNKTYRFENGVLTKVING